MKVHQKRVHGKGDPTGPTSVKVKLDMTKEEATKLFHSVNRMLSLIDDEVGQGARLDPSDQVAYDQTNDFIAQLQRELQIEPEEG